MPYAGMLAQPPRAAGSPPAGAVRQRGFARPSSFATDWHGGSRWNAACCWCTRTRTTSRSAPAPRWPSTPPRARASRWSPARSASSARSSRPTCATCSRTSSASTGSASSTAPAQALGVNDHRFLGGEGRYRDSGMMGLPDNDDPRCFWRADVDEAADAARRGHRRGRGRRDRDLRRRRLLRPPRPHPGAPGHRPGARAGRGGRQALRDRDAPLGAGRRRRAAGRLLVRPQRRPVRQRPRRRRSRPRSTRPRTWTPSGRRCAPTRPRSPWTATTSRCPTRSASGSSAPSTTPSSRARAARRRPGGALRARPVRPLSR